MLRYLSVVSCQLLGDFDHVAGIHLTGDRLLDQIDR